MNQTHLLYLPVCHLLTNISFYSLSPSLSLSVFLSLPPSLRHKERQTEEKVSDVQTVRQGEEEGGMMLAVNTAPPLALMISAALAVVLMSVYSACDS